MHRTQKLAILFILLVIILSFFSCGGAKKTEDSRTVFRYNEMAVISSLDPAAARNYENIWAVNQLYNGLVQMDDNLNVVPCIASHWKISEDGKTYTFTIRNNVFFHDHEIFPNGKGRQVKAADVVYSFNRLYDARVSSAMSLLENIDKDNGGFSAPNDSTFIITLKEPFSPFLGILTMKYFSIVPKEIVEHYGDEFRKHPVGTGPFCFKMWEEDNQLILVKNENYFETDAAGNKLPYLDAVAVSFIKNKETAFLQFLKGEVDMLSSLNSFNPNEVLDEDGNLKPYYAKQFNLQTQPYLKTDYLGILIDEKLPHVKKSPLRLKTIRKAINYGFDREKMVKYFNHNLGIPATAGFIPSGLPSFDPEKVSGYRYNPEKVKELLIEAGFPEGKGLPEITLYTSENYLDILEFIQGDLAKNNIKIKIEIEKSSVLTQAVANNELLFFKKSWIGDYPDEENFMSLFYSKNYSPVGFNYTHYNNPDFDRLYLKAKNTVDPQERKKLYQEMDRMIIDDAPVVPMFYDKVVRLVRKDVSNLNTNPMNMLNLVRVKKQVSKKS